MLPRFITPEVCAEPPAGDVWLHEVKADGYRVQVRVEDGRARVFTRRGYDWTETFWSIALTAAGLPIGAGILDGEAAVVGDDGVTDFDALRAEMGRPSLGRPSRIR